MIFTLILLTILYTLCADEASVNANGQSSASTVRYSPYTDTGICAWNSHSNQTLAREDMFTFNFNDGSNGYKIFQVPRCLFDTTAAKEIFASVDLSEDIDSYRRRFKEFLIIPLNGAYRLVPKSPTKDYPNSGLSPPPSSSITIKDFIIDLRTPHKVLKDKLCVITDHPVLFPIRLACSHHILSWTEYTVTVSLTQKFFIITVSPNPSPSDKTLALFFGDITELSFKAPYNTAAFLLRQTADHDLLTLVKYNAYLQQYRFLTEKNFLSRPLSSDYTAPNICIRMLSIMASRVLKGGYCGTINRYTVEFFFSYGLCLFVTDPITYKDDDSISDAAWRQSELELIGNFVHRCFQTANADPVPPLQSRMTFMKTSDKSHENDVRKVVATLATAMNVGTLADMTYLLRADNIPPNVNEDDLFHKLLYTVDAYYRTTLRNSLMTSMRRVLIRVDAAIRTQLNESNWARMNFVLLASMCSQREMLDWSAVVVDPKKGAPSEIYSPCISGARRDYTQETLSSLMRASRRPEYRAEVMINVTHILRPLRYELSDETRCVPEGTLGAIVTAPLKTYSITSEFILKGLTIPVRNTVVGKNLLITVLEHRSQCIVSRTYRELGSIVTLKNVTFTDQCEFCGSTLIEYDEVDGLTDIIHIPTITDLKYITDPENEILIATPRVHYLLLSKNGTVLEVTDILVNVKKISYPIIVVLLIVFILLCIGLYKLCRIK
nr:envelope glycoprotein H [Mastomys natalensis cytomegalovirus 3]WEG69901.1 envelope glycoprotein H [Mastomys natalensis cytomegalovirus 3]WEG70041.1 envelope glycoprotein H [Mastomys natalensis cytomegalovirus 3]WEG70181.1 envelope glycoprotein H [Mastomys natalensis cytomegalovirus 3]WEG70321.1 envelope glycoprotein H [Mastomys natalensis cytomegalovirus 3]